MYLIIEVFNRELCSVHTALTSREAVDTANRVLKEHCDAIGRSEAYDQAEAELISTGETQMDGIGFSSQDAMDAWCNFRDEGLDIFVTWLDDKYWTTSLDVPDGAAGQPLLNGVTEYRVSLKITKEEARRLDAWLENDAHQDEDNVFSRTAVFPDGRQMDIKCCGVQDSEQSSWAEAVLFEPNGQEICCTEPAFEYTGTWELTAKGVRYIVDVTATE